MLTRKIVDRLQKQKQRAIIYEQVGISKAIKNKFLDIGREQKGATPTPGGGGPTKGRRFVPPQDSKKLRHGRFENEVVTLQSGLPKVNDKFDFINDYESSDYDYISDEEFKYMKHYQDQNLQKFNDLKDQLQGMSPQKRRGSK